MKARLWNLQYAQYVIVISLLQTDSLVYSAIQYASLCSFTPANNKRMIVSQTTDSGSSHSFSYCFTFSHVLIKGLYFFVANHITLCFIYVSHDIVTI